MDTKRETEQLLVLKVMRLTRPTLSLTQPVRCDSRDLPRDCLHGALCGDLTAVPALPHFALGQLLTLPQNFGNIFLGETFSCYISVHNDSPYTCIDVIVKADLQTSSQRLALSPGVQGDDGACQLGPEDRVDGVIHHEVKELGTHILVCSVSYSSHTAEKLYFRKFFKFQVLKPLDVKTKFFNTESDDVYLEAQIQNITPNPIFMERVWLEPSPQYTVKVIRGHYPKDSDSKEATAAGEGGEFGRANYMNPMDVRQYLYCLTPRLQQPESEPNSTETNRPVQLKGVTNIGKLDMVWKTSMGEQGRLQTSALQRVAPGYGDIRLSVESIPDSVPVEKVFDLVIIVTNCSERTMDLVLQLHNSLTASLCWCGTSGKQLGKLAAGNSTSLHLSMIPLATGLLTISGLRLVDSFLKRTYEYDDITQIYVE